MYNLRAEDNAVITEKIATIRSIFSSKIDIFEFAIFSDEILNDETFSDEMKES